MHILLLHTQVWGCLVSGVTISYHCVVTPSLCSSSSSPSSIYETWIPLQIDFTYHDSRSAIPLVQMFCVHGHRLGIPRGTTASLSLCNCRVVELPYRYAQRGCHSDFTAECTSMQCLIRCPFPIGWEVPEQTMGARHSFGFIVPVLLRLQRPSFVDPS